MDQWQLINAICLCEDNKYKYGQGRWKTLAFLILAFWPGFDLERAIRMARFPKAASRRPLIFSEPAGLQEDVPVRTGAQLVDRLRTLADWVEERLETE